MPPAHYFCPVPTDAQQPRRIHIRLFSGAEYIKPNGFRLNCRRCSQGSGIHEISRRCHSDFRRRGGGSHGEHKAGVEPERAWPILSPLLCLSQLSSGSAAVNRALHLPSIALPGGCANRCAGDRTGLAEGKQVSRDHRVVVALRRCERVAAGACVYQ